MNVELGKHISLSGGGTPSKAIDKYWNGNIPWASVKDLTGKFVNKTIDKITIAGIQNSATRIVPRKHLIIATRMAVGRIAITKVDVAINQDLKAIKCSPSIFYKYLYYFLKSKEEYFNKVATGATVKGIKIEHITKLQIPLPPLPTQKKIAAILDAADTYRQKTKALIEKYDELTQSLFLDMFGDPVTNPKGWEKIKLGDICGVGSSKRVFVKDLKNSGIPFYRGTEVGKLGEDIEISPKYFISEQHYLELIKEKGVPSVGDLLLPSICPDGRIFRVINSDPFYFKDGRVLWIKVNNELISSIYLRYFLKEIFFTNYLNIASGTTFAELKIVALKKIEVLMPPLKAQNKFKTCIETLYHQKTQAQASLSKAEDLFQSLLQKAFKGKLVN